jgi:hypothetical protein
MLSISCSLVNRVKRMVYPKTSSMILKTYRLSMAFDGVYQMSRTIRILKDEDWNKGLEENGVIKNRAEFPITFVYNKKRAEFLPTREC